jgi:hypothetical protein
MQKRKPGNSNLEVSALGLGCMGLLPLSMLFLTSCIEMETASSGGTKNKIIYGAGNGNMENPTNKGHLTTNDCVRDLVNHQAFKGFGELMLPWDDNASYYNTTLNQVGSLMPYHSQVNPDIVVGALNHIIDEVNAGKTIFYDFYTERQKQEDPAKNSIGLFFYRGKPGAPFAIVCPGGGFSYVASLHEGFPLAWEISKKGW